MEVVDGEDADSLNLLDSTGNTLACYYWLNAFGPYPAGWFLDSQGDDEAGNVTFDKMEGFLFYSAATEAKLKHWGEVLEGNITSLALNTGYTTLGNPYNKALPLENLVPVNAEDADSLNLLDSTGNTLACYYWLNAFGPYPAGWFLDSQGDDEAENVTLDPSEAFLFYSAADAATLNVTAP